MSTVTDSVVNCTTITCFKDHKFVLFQVHCTFDLEISRTLDLHNLPGFVASLLELVYAKLPGGTMEPGKAGNQVGPQLLCVDVQTIGHIYQLRTQLHRQQKKGRGSAAEPGHFRICSSESRAQTMHLGTRPTQEPLSLGHTSRASASDASGPNQSVN